MLGVKLLAAAASRFFPIVMVAAIFHACVPSGSRLHSVGETGKSKGKAGGLKLKESVAGISHGFKVLNASPTGEVDENPEILVSFTNPVRDMNAGMNSSVQGIQPIMIQPPLEGEVEWLNSRVAVFRPFNPLPGATDFTVEVPGGLCDLLGNQLEESYVWHFSTTRPRVKYHKPEGEAVCDKKIHLYFNQEVDPVKVAKYSELRFTRKGKKETVTKFKAALHKDDKSVVLDPLYPLPLDTTVEYVLSKGFTSEEGPRAITKDIKFTLKIHGPLKIIGTRCLNHADEEDTSCYPDSDFVVGVNNWISEDDLKKFIKIKPASKFIVSFHEHDYGYAFYIRIHGYWKPRSTHSITIRKWLKDDCGQALGKDYVTKFIIGDYEPSLRLEIGDGEIIESPQRMNTMVDIMNLKHVKYAIRWLGTDQEKIVRNIEEAQEGFFKPRAGLKEFEAYHAGEKDRTGSLSYKSKPNQWASVKFPIDKEIQKAGAKGVGFIHFMGEGGETWKVASDASWFRVCDIGINAKFSYTGILIWVTDIATGEPVGEANVSVRDKSGSLVVSGKSDAGGFFHVPKPVVKKKLFHGEERGNLNKHNFMPYVFASKGASFGLAGHMDSMDSNDFEVNGHDVNQDINEGARRQLMLVFTDRDVYKPGEEVHVKGVVRELEDDILTIPEGDELSLSVEDRSWWFRHIEDRDLVHKARVKVGEFGGFSFTFKLASRGAAVTNCQRM